MFQNYFSPNQNLVDTMTLITSFFKICPRHGSFFIKILRITWFVFSYIKTWTNTLLYNTRRINSVVGTITRSLDKPFEFILY